MRSPTDLPARVLAYCKDHDLLPKDGVVLCALSGGRDSMALLYVLRTLSDELGFSLRAAHYNHQLRGEESLRDEQFVAAWCRDNHIPLIVHRGDVAGAAARHRRGIEETARIMRYDFLQKTADDVGAQVIATAHNADDNAETVLLHLVRGAGLDGLAGISPKRDNIIRPLLAIPRADIDAYIETYHIPYVEDSSNADLSYARNRLRHQVMPVLRELNPAFSQTLAANLPHLRGDQAVLDGLAREVLDAASCDGDAITFSVSALGSLPAPVALRSIKLGLAKLGRYQVSAVHLEQVLDLALSQDPAGQCSLPRGLLARREYDKLILTHTQPRAEGFPPILLHGEGTYPLPNGWIVGLKLTGPKIVQKGPFLCDVCADSLSWPLTLRTRHTGDLLRLPGRREKPLKKWYIDEKIPRLRRDWLPILADEHGIIAAAGLGPAEERLASIGEPALRVTFTPPTIPISKEREEAL